MPTIRISARSETSTLVTPKRLIDRVGQDVIRARGGSEIRGKLRVESEGTALKFHVGNRALLRVGDEIYLKGFHSVGSGKGRRHERQFRPYEFADGYSIETK